MIKRSGMLTLSVGSATGQVAALLRYALLARVLGPEQLGLAAILILTAQFFEQITDAGLDRFLVQSRAGNTRSVNAAIHALLIGRGLVIGSAIALSGGLLAAFFGYPALRDGLLLLAVAPAIAGFSHYDYRRVQRHHSFRAEGLITTISELTSLVVIVVAAVATRSFVAVALALIARSSVTVLVSHLVARRPYRLGLPRAHAPALLAFGLPLMFNGILLFLTGQGDRLLIGNQIGAAALGHYSATILLIYYPAMVLSRLLHSIDVPTVAAARDDDLRQRAIIDRIAGETVLLGCSMAIGFTVVAPFVVPIIYGSQFALPALVISLIGALQAARFVRIWPATVALATGETTVLLLNNSVRLVAFPIATALLSLLSPLLAIVTGFLVAEFGALGVTVYLLHRKGRGLPKRDWTRLSLLLLLLTSLVIFIANLGATNLVSLIVSGCSFALSGMLITTHERHVLVAGAARFTGIILSRLRRMDC